MRPRESTLKEEISNWEQAALEVERIIDKLGEKIDAGIKDTVIALRALGVNTSQSCEGHEDRGIGGPYVDIQCPQADEWEEEIKALKNNPLTQNKIIEKLRKFNLLEKNKVAELLTQFYKNREVEPEDKLILTPKGLYGRVRLVNQGVIKRAGELSGKFDRERLKRYQQEMTNFTIFLKELYLQKVKELD